jgi:hypothetical protein
MMKFTSRAAFLWIAGSLSAVADTAATGSFTGKLAEGSELGRLWSAPPIYQNPGNPASPSYSHSSAISNELTQGPCGLTTEFFQGHGANGRPDIHGFTAMPSYSLTEKLQLVTTLQFAGSHEDNGISLPLRDEGQISDAGDKLGDLYFAGCAGPDYYIHGHKLQLMPGVKYTCLSGGPGGGDFTGWTWLAGLRIAF